MSASVCPRQQGQIDRQTDDQDECDRETVKLNLIRIKCASMTVFVAPAAAARVTRFCGISIYF